ncbi:hypothetical protein [Vibrio gallaecicus]|uniref:hypothetical protein n=1 Tax=Vibrio gallaecicus TaxID=552386 RepID=UPI0025B3297F|nr:hypothetical protein [Vibrio gallaecicus]MDN3617153.1 hypothetical protein [Vibrio gallaecicus]
MVCKIETPVGNSMFSSTRDMLFHLWITLFIYGGYFLANCSNSFLSETDATIAVIPT